MSDRDWNMTSYQQIKSVGHSEGKLIVEFLDGSKHSLPLEQLMTPSNLTSVNVEELRFNPYEIIISTPEGEKEIPWTTIRLLTDPDFAKYWANMAEVEASQVGKRLRVLRKSRHLSGKEVAERAGITPQSLSRIENGHHDVVFTTLKKILAAMGYKLSDLTNVEYRGQSIEDIVKRLDDIGIKRDFIYKRLFFDVSGETGHIEPLNYFVETVSRIYKFSRDEIFTANSLTLDTSTMDVKLKSSQAYVEKQTNAYTFYAHYLSLLALNAIKVKPQKVLPQKADELRNSILDNYRSLSFESLLAYAWDMGIPVVPLVDPGAFHGACWNINGQIAIVLKQSTNSQGRWLYDLAHEFGHAIIHSSSRRTSIVEGEEVTPFNESQEEEEANAFATELLLHGNQEALVEKCVSVARGKVEYLKSAVLQVATSENVPVDLLANYLAFRLQKTNNTNWWGTANNLQITEPSPLALAKETMINRLDLDTLSREDRILLLKAIEI